MRVKILLSIMMFIIFNSCDYKRQQNIPENLNVENTSEYCNFNIYITKEIILKSKDNFDTNDWQKGLVCQGYAEDPKQINWQPYEDLEYNYIQGINYFIEKIENCFDKKFSLGEIFIAACITRINDVEGNKDITFHKIFLFDKKNFKFYEVENLN